MEGIERYKVRLLPHNPEWKFQNMDIEAMKNNGYSFCGLQAPYYDRYLFVLCSESQLSLQHIHCYEQNNNDFF